MAKTLLDKARSVKTTGLGPKVEVSQEMEDVALAWCRGEITLTQIARALNLNNTGYRTYSLLALALKSHLNKKSSKSSKK